MEVNNWKAVVSKIIERGRFAQWVGIIMAGTVAIWGGAGGWLTGGEVVKLVIAGLGVAGGVELLKLLKGGE